MVHCPYMLFSAFVKKKDFHNPFYFSECVEVIPRPGEIVFCNMDREGNSSMTWSYSEPRVISAVSSTPVPFNTPGIYNVVRMIKA